MLGSFFFFFIFYSELSLWRTVLRRKILEPYKRCLFFITLTSIYKAEFFSQSCIGEVGIGAKTEVDSETTFDYIFKFFYFNWSKIMKSLWTKE